MGRRARVSISTGGSIVAPEQLDPEFLVDLAAVLMDAAEDRDLLIVVGGGRTARRYIAACRELGASETFMDEVGIECTRLNARLLIAALGTAAHQGVPRTVEEAVEVARNAPVVVMGGTHPGQTTDAVTADLAVAARAEEMVVLTNVDGVYTADPKKDPNARRLTSITTSRLMEIVAEGDYAAGSSTVVDPVAATTIHEGRVPVKVLDGRDLSQVQLALAGEEFHGTTVTPDGGS